jgi:hypothetical protein
VDIIDICEDCPSRGNLEKCLKTKYTHHVAWIVTQIRSSLGSQIMVADALLNAIKKILAGENIDEFELSFPVVRGVYDLKCRILK